MLNASSGIAKELPTLPEGSSVYPVEKMTVVDLLAQRCPQCGAVNPCRRQEQSLLLVEFGARRLDAIGAEIARKADATAFDRTVFDDAARLLARFEAPLTGQARSLFKRDWTETATDIVGDYVRDRGSPVERLSRADRIAVLTGWTTPASSANAVPSPLWPMRCGCPDRLFTSFSPNVGRKTTADTDAS
jgi:hypothetical protein